MIQVLIFLYKSNTPSYKKLDDFQSSSSPACTKPLHPFCSTSCGSWGRVLYSFLSLPQQYLLHSFIHFDGQLSLSLSLSSIDVPTTFCPNLGNFLRCLAPRECEKTREDQAPSFLNTWWTLATWCVRYSWSFAPRQLEVAWELPIGCG